MSHYRWTPIQPLVVGGLAHGQKAARSREELQSAGAGDAVLWEAVRQIGRELVDVLGDDLDGAQAWRLIETALSDWVQDQASAGRPLPPAPMQRGLARLIFDRRYGLGALQPYLRRDDVENIVVNGHAQTWVTYTDGTKEAGPAVAGSDEELIEWVQLLARRGTTGREFSRANPLLDLALADGVRLAVVHWVSRRPHLALRVHRLIDVTLADLTDRGTLSEPVAWFLRAALRARRNLVVCGEVNTGKTTLVRALANELDPDERIITLESDFELFLDDPQLASRHHDVVAWEARQANSEGAGQIRLQDLVPASLRMNPDRVIVGEARQGELAPMLEVMYSGARGSMCTLHVHRPAHIFNRVIQLGRRAGLGYTPQDLHLMFGLAEPLIIYLERDPATNARFVSEVMEVGPPADGVEPTRNHVFVPGREGRATPAGGHISADLLDELTAAGLDPDLLAQAPGGWS
ncbi:ATPase, T2SS/T4P/T4SS family [Actinoallomurus bryophytorum]|uniref:Flp pilus assembly CpaF family ATPase n=1 Tax=Actinoallomurus bryophytorum TaxID=1490222 RepID=A0A543CHM9_9ACTN|nr:ATPase, T2SS/T4P/T4SS family [Actinoallomurus bryophytorum]TQL96591.1 Flp pilus assembly CpaF family ATPase [Actinoallomurus bryophytorum]